MANQKLTELSQISDPALEDYLYTVDDPTGTPVSDFVSSYRLFGKMMRGIADGRLTLASGIPVYRPMALIPSSTDTTAETTTFAAAHGWVTGTIVSVRATANGLTTGTRYWINAASSTAVSYHTNFADAVAGTNKVNLTGNITAQVVPSGLNSKFIYYAPFTGNLISVHDGTRWKLYEFAELTLTLGTLTNNLNYDVFIYDSSGTLTLEALAWSTDTARATDIVKQDGIWVKSGATTRRYLGTFRTDSTTSTISDSGGLASQVGGKLFLWNKYNKVIQLGTVYDSTTDTYNTATVRQKGGAAGNRIDVVIGVQEDNYNVFTTVHGICSNNPNLSGTGGIGIDQTTVMIDQVKTTGGVTAFTYGPGHSEWSGGIPIGLHAINWLQFALGNAGTWTWSNGSIDGKNISQGVMAYIPC